MAVEILYCVRCSARVTGNDLDSGRAVRAEAGTVCAGCATPAELRAVKRPAAPPAPAPVPAPATRGNSTRRRLPPAASRGLPGWMLAGAVGAGVAALGAVLALSGGRREPPPAPPQAPPAQVQVPKPPPPRAPAGPTRQEEREVFEARIQALVEKGDLEGAVKAAEEAGAAHEEPEWKGPFDRRSADLSARLSGKQRKSDELAAAASPPVDVYADALASGWLDWSWGGPRNFAAAGGLEGSRALEIRPGEKFSGLYLHSQRDLQPGDFTAIEFHVRAGAEGQALMMSAWSTEKKSLGAVQLAALGGQPPAGAWKRYVVPLASLHAAGVPLGGFMWQESTGKPDGSPILFDRIRLHRVPPRE